LATNPYFTNGTSGEKTLYEDLIIESIRIHGLDVYYVPRTIERIDQIMNEAAVSTFVDAFPIELYVESYDSFEGDGTLLSKFGLEIRNQMRVAIAKRTWNTQVGSYGRGYNSYRPTEGDLIYIPLTKGLFEVKFVDVKTPFYQLQNLPVYKINLELYEYRGERIDTGIPEIDAFQSKFAAGIKFDYNYLYALSIRTDSGGNTRVLSDGTTIRVTVEYGVTIIPFAAGDRISIDYADGVVVGTAEILEVTDSTIKISDIVYNDGRVREFTTSVLLTNETTGSVAGITRVYGLDDTDEDITDDDVFAKNATFQTAADELIDFTESNPFGEA
jgi:hypothetical protein